MTITTKTLDEIIEAGKAATPGPWAYGNFRNDARSNAYIEAIEKDAEEHIPYKRAFATVWTKTEANRHDPSFIALAGTHMLALATELKRAREALGIADEALKRYSGQTLPTGERNERGNLKYKDFAQEARAAMAQLGDGE